MKFTLWLDDNLVNKVRKIAMKKNMSLTGSVRSYLEQLAVESASAARKRRQRELLQRSFIKFRFKGGQRTWTRADLYERF